MNDYDDTLEREWEETNMALFHYRMDEDRQIAIQEIDQDIEYIERWENES